MLASDKIFLLVMDEGRALKIINYSVLFLVSISLSGCIIGETYLEALKSFNPATWSGKPRNDPPVCYYKGFTSENTVALLNKSLSENKSNIIAKSIVINKSIDNEDRNSIKENTIICRSEIELHGGGKESGYLTFKEDNEGKPEVTWESDNDIKKTKEDEIKERNRKEIEFNSISIKAYPYMAYVSCKLMGYDYPIIHCAYGTYTQSTFEIKNGNNYNMYQGADIGAAGNNSVGVLRIPLSKHFQINVRNGSGNSLINMKIIDRATGSIVFEKSAGMYNYISVEN
ncbi:MAG: hypothetical protein ACRDCA_12365 [Serratia sp. (in: enterobacteria)]|uniref:hypothetical protein n=1 Tax=Serratia sp. (in: enterobacteria) TaxID=616 RepID=UPI003F374932